MTKQEALAILDRGRALPVRAESGLRTGHRTWKEAGMSAFVLMSPTERAEFRAWLETVKW